MTPSQTSQLIEIFEKLEGNVFDFKEVIQIFYYVARRKQLRDFKLRRFQQLVGVVVFGVIVLIIGFKYLENSIVTSKTTIAATPTKKQQVYKFSKYKFSPAYVVMMDRANGSWVENLKQNEGFRSKQYWDKVGKCSKKGCLTIGYGHCIDRKCGNGRVVAESILGRKITKKTVITMSEAETIINYDVNNARQLAKKYLTWFGYLSKKQRETVTEMVFNGGMKTFLSLKRVVSHLKAGNPLDAARAFSQSLWCRQIGNRCEQYMRGLSGK
jgi:GH24 family phage-related lysozyme (muramidase)